MPWDASISRLRGKHTRPVAGRLHDLSHGGVCFESPEPFEIGEMLQIEFGTGARREFETFSEVVWRSPGREGFRVGTCFLVGHAGDADAVAGRLDPPGGPYQTAANA